MTVTIAPLKQFVSEGFEKLFPMIGRTKLSKAIIDLAHPMLDRELMRQRLLLLLKVTANRTLKESGYIGGNVAQLMLASNPHALMGADINGVKLRGANFNKTIVRTEKGEN